MSARGDEQELSGYVGRCKFCGHVGPLETEVEFSHGRIICRDAKACDERWLAQ